MRFLIGSLALLTSAVALGDEAQMKQWEKMDRCSNAAFIAVQILEESADTGKQAIALHGAVQGLKTNTKLAEATPTENEVRSAYNFALRISYTMPRPFAKREHDWLIAQAATSCTLWVPSAHAQ
ncbi:hypothetical protein IFT48_27160 [Pseudomonas fluorescens]|uniref:hypothetical protein n=1 Tax=Pseudomonas TaxID=286 RepID=UPI001908EC25|nr:MULTISPECIES: hypothetical protein [Pseudomonas]MBD8093677.1 hypothetical protein [Pseudomonas fluorescens]MBD8717680.1 hypothetical protein [Pseudomonas fluorescens]MDL2185133.1 hypothetical protein [Pseudomonas sp. ChxA]